MDKREILKKLHEARKTGHFPGDPKVGARLLEDAKKDQLQRQAEADNMIKDYSWEAAGYIRNKARGKVYFIPK